MTHRMISSIYQAIYRPSRTTLPDSVFEKREAKKAVAPYRNAGVAFIHVPRTAGLSLLQATYHSGDIRHFTLAQYRSVEKSVVLPTFTVVRNPWDRVVSAWLIARQGGVPGGAQMFRPDQYKKLIFTTFESFVFGYLALRWPEDLDPVFKPQVYYTGTDESAFDHVGRFTDLGATADWLSGTLNRPVVLPHANKINHDPYQSYYRPATKQMVSYVYRKDIETFGFTFDD